MSNVIIWLFVSIFAIHTGRCKYLLQTEMIKSYLKYKSVGTAVVFTCMGKQGIVSNTIFFSIRKSLKMCTLQS